MSGKKTVSIAAAAALLALTGLFPSSRPRADRGYPEIISVPRTPAVEKALAGMDLDLLLEKDGRIFIVAGRDDLYRLSEKNIPWISAASSLPAFSPDRAGEGGPNGAYHSPVELERDLKALEGSYPALARLSVIGRSLEGRNIYALKISRNVARNEGEPGILIVGCHHAREWISVEIPYLFGKHLVEHYADDPSIRALVDGSDTWIVPLINPDGLEYSIRVYRYWRKNRRLNGDGSLGVDLNRNYSFQWGYDDLGSSPSPQSGVYRGTGPFSEPETQALRDLFLRESPDAVVSYHSYSGTILYPWGYADLATGHDEELSFLARGMAELMNRVGGHPYAYGRASSTLYTTNGDTVDWTFALSGAPSFTIELPPADFLHGGFINSEEDIDLIFRENLPALLFLADHAIRRSRNGGTEKPSLPRDLPLPRKPRAVRTN